MRMDPIPEVLIASAIGKWEGSVFRLSLNEWEKCLKEADYHGLTPLLGHSILNSSWFEDIPEAISDRLSKAYNRAAVLGIRMAQELKVLRREFEKAGIPFLILKGITLAERLYGNLALRPCEDIDVLIKKKDLYDSIKLIKTQGYILRNQNLLKAHTKWHFNLTMDKSGTLPICLELHWALRDRFSLQLVDLEEIWQRSKDNHMSEIDEFLYLCAHIDMHGYMNSIVRAGDDSAWVKRFILHRDSENRMIWFSDLYRFLLKYEEILRPEILEERANEWGITEALKNCFIILDRIDTECLPEIYRPLMFLRRSKAFSSRFIYRMVMGGPPPTLSKENIQKRWFLKKGQNAQFRPIRLIDIIRYIFPSRSYLKRCYPRLSRVWPLTIFLHLGLLIIRHARETVSLFLEMNGPLQGTRLTDRR